MPTYESNLEKIISVLDQTIGFIQWSTDVDSDSRSEIIKEIWNIRQLIKLEFKKEE